MKKDNLNSFTELKQTERQRSNKNFIEKDIKQTQNRHSYDSLSLSANLYQVSYKDTQISHSSKKFINMKQCNKIKENTAENSFTDMLQMKNKQMSLLMTNKSCKMTGSVTKSQEIENEQTKLNVYEKPTNFSKSRMFEYDHYEINNNILKKVQGNSPVHFYEITAKDEKRAPSTLFLRFFIISMFSLLVGAQDCNPISTPSCSPSAATSNPAQALGGQSVPGSVHPTNDCKLTQSGSGLVNFCPPTTLSAPAQQKTYPAAPYFPNGCTPADKNCKKVIKSGTSPINSLERIDPSLAKELQRILTYSGIKEPWNRVKDFFDDSQRMMPDPCMLYGQMRDILKVFESLKELISDELRKIQIYVERAKMYLKEDHVKLKDQLSRMSQLLARMKSTKDKQNQADYANQFNRVNEETQKQISQYNALKDWLFETLTNFKRLF